MRPRFCSIKPRGNAVEYGLDYCQLSWYFVGLKNARCNKFENDDIHLSRK